MSNKSIPHLLVVLDAALRRLDLELLVEDLCQEFPHLPVGQTPDFVEERICGGVLTKVISFINIP